jgi:iron(III) transport system substrate-binding protein
MRFRNFNNLKASIAGRIFALFLCLLFLSVMLSQTLAAASETARTAKLIDGAKKEGKVVWYTTLNAPEADELLKAFNKKYPFIKPEFYRSGDQKLMTKILAEGRAKKYLYDVVMTTGVSAEILKEKGFMAKYDSPERQFYPEGLKDPEGYWTDIYLNLNVIGYNTRRVSRQEALKSYQDLLDPKWKGHMGMDVKAFYWFANMLKTMGEEQGLAYMKKLSEQNIQFRSGRTLNAQLLVAGEVNVCVTLYNNRVEQMKAEGAPIEWIAFEPVVPEIHPMAVSAHPLHPNAAKLLVDFILSKAGQEKIASFFRIPSRADVKPIKPSMKEGLKILPFDFTIKKDYGRYVKLYRKILMKQ